MGLHWRLQLLLPGSWEKLRVQPDTGAASRMSVPCGGQCGSPGAKPKPTCDTRRMVGSPGEDTELVGGVGLRGLLAEGARRLGDERSSPVWTPHGTLLPPPRLFPRPQLVHAEFLALSMSGPARPEILVSHPHCREQRPGQPEGPGLSCPMGTNHGCPVQLATQALLCPCSFSGDWH